MVGVALSTYANWKYGYNDPDMDLAKVLNTLVDYLTGKIDNPSASKEERLDLDIKDNPHLLNMLSYNGQHLDDETKRMYIRLARSQMLDKKDSD